MGLIVALVAVVAAAASITAVETRSARLASAACAGVIIPTAPAGSSIVFVSRGEPEVTALAGSGNPALMRAGAALRHALGQSDNAEQVITALTEAAKECRALGLPTQADS